MRYPARWFTSVLVSLLVAPAIAAAQPAFELPQPSPSARAEQRVGITAFSIDYSSPGVKGRKIWGELVPFDKAWRAGANQSTTLTVSRDFKLGATPVKAGSYSIFMIPTKKSWTVILNSDVNAGANHDPKKDIAKEIVTPTQLAQPRERLTYMFSDTTDDRTSLDLEWESMRIRVPLSVNTRSHVEAAIDEATNAAWQPHFRSANYLFQAGDVKRALPLVQKSISIKQTFRNEWLQAQLLMKTGKKAAAKAAANRALKLGAGQPAFEQFFKAEITKTIASWK
ncbi:MAG: DUF2911 domain-containing protein [Kofleriaceae bacterium]